MRVRPTLAIVDGSEPAFSSPLHVGRPNLGKRQRFFELAHGIFDRNWLTNSGPLVEEFEHRISAYVGVKHCVSTCNATVALELATRAADLHGEVIVPSFTFIATAHALQWQGITPVFCDIDPATHCLDPQRVEEMITPRTTGIIGVHLWGRTCDVEALTEISRRRNLTLVFDAAHAFGCSCKGKMVGGFGLAEVFSFHATKFFNTFEGGAVVTNDDALAEKVRLMRNFGFAGYDNVIYIGTNGKMPEVSAAMGLSGLENLEEFIAVNRRNYDAYRSGLAGLPGVSVISYDEDEKCNFHYVVVEVDGNQCGLERDSLLKVLHAENVLARRYFWPGCHRMEPYRSYFPHAGLLLPVTERVSSRILILPTGMATGPGEIDVVCAIIRTALAQAGRVRGALVRSEQVSVPLEVENAG
jgi:dTDP-4-amino-4,6-dideoxygalactose transaminase